MWSCDNAHFRHFLDIVICKQQFLLNQSIVHSTCKKRSRSDFQGVGTLVRKGSQTMAAPTYLPSSLPRATTARARWVRLINTTSVNFKTDTNWKLIFQTIPFLVNLGLCPFPILPLPWPPSLTTIGQDWFQTRIKQSKQQQYSNTDQYWQQSNRTENKLTHSILSV